MPETLEIIPEKEVVVTPVFEKPEDYERFREEFMEEVIPKQEAWQEARRKSEQESRERLLR